MSLIIRVFILSVLIVTNALSQSVSNSSNTVIPLDPAIRTGILPNGLKYYIRTNKEPQKRAELRLVVNAGSLMEDDDQQGLAHFVEHMAFNGTTNFPKHKLVDYLESIGVQFGGDMNAETGFESTIYMLRIPTDSGKHLETGLQVLEDWAHNINFDSAEVEAERPVIVGEWRSSLGVQKRIRDQQTPFIFQGSRYSSRIPIGRVETIEHASRDKIVRFYKDWYRPDLMAVIAVGDFDPIIVERIIRDKFSRITPAVSPRKRERYNIPAGYGTQVSIVSDPEISNTSINVMFKGIPYLLGSTVADYRKSIIRDLFRDMLNQRLDEIARKPDAPFLNAETFYPKLGGNLGIYQLSAVARNNEVDKTLDAILTELRRVGQHGFTRTELELARQRYLRILENALVNKDKVSSVVISNNLISHFLNNTAVASTETMTAFGRQLIPDITISDMNKEAKVIPQASRLILITLPQKENIKRPVQRALVGLVEMALKKNVEPHKEETVAVSLLGKLPVSGKVISETLDSASGVIEWKLSNGARLLLKPTDFHPDQVLLRGYSRGGYQLASDADFISALFIKDVVGPGGYGELSAEEVERVTAGKIASVSLDIDQFTESVQGSASAKDLETMFQLLYLKFTAPRYDSSAVAAELERDKAFLANRNADPNTAYSDTIRLTMSQYHPRSPIVAAELISKVSPKRAYDLYRERFANASDFTFTLIGAFNPDSIKPLVESYMASLPGTDRIDKKFDPGIHAPNGIVHKVVRAGKEPQATTAIIFHGPYVRSYTNGIEFSALNKILELRLTEIIREQLGGTYGVQVQGSVNPDPREEYSIVIAFIAEPKRLDDLVQSVMQEIEKIKREGPTAEELAKVKEAAARSLELARKRNDQWTEILRYDRYGWPFTGIGNDSAWTALTRDQIKAAAQKYLKQNNYARFDLMPK